MNTPSCPQCGAGSQPGPYCTACGAAVAAPGASTVEAHDRCPRCGDDGQPGPFCTACGASVAAESAPPGTAPQQGAPIAAPAAAAAAQQAPPSAAQAVPPPTSAQMPPTATGQPKSRKGCCIGCGATALALLLACSGVALFLALRPSPSERLLSGTPDRAAAEEILADMQASGLDTTGVNVVVMPIGDTGGKLAYASIDMSVDRPTTEDPVNDYLVGLATGPSAEKYAVSRASIDMVDADGEPAITVTADTESISAFANGTMSRDDFLGEVDGKLSPLDAALAVME